MVTWRSTVECWASVPQTSFYTQEVKHLSDCLGRFLQGSQMFPPMVATKGAVICRAGGARLPKSQKWAHMLLGMLDMIATGTNISLQQVTVHKTITDIWKELGLEEMPKEYSDSNVGLKRVPGGGGGPRFLMMG